MEPQEILNQYSQGAPPLTDKIQDILNSISQRLLESSSLPYDDLSHLQKLLNDSAQHLNQLKTYNQKFLHSLQQITHSHIFYHHSFQNSPIPILRTNLEGLILDANPAARSIICRPKVPLKTIDALLQIQLPKHPKQQWKKFFQKLANSNSPTEAQIHLQFPGFPTLFFDLIGVRLSPSDAIIYFLHQNISQSKNQHFSCPLAREIIENAGFGFFIFHLENPHDDRSFRLIYANQTCWKLIKKHPDEIVGKLIDEANPLLRSYGVPPILLKIAHGLQPPQHLEIPYHDDSVGNVVYSVNIFPLSGLRVAVVFSDVTKTKFYQHELEKNQEGLQILVEFALQLLNTNFDSFNLITNSYLAKLASIVKADRAYIFCRDSNGTTISCTHEWCAEGISPQIHNCKNCPIEFLDEMAEIDKLGPFGVEVELLPKDSPFRALLESQDIKNMINYPIRLNNKFVGLVGFDSVSHKRLFSPTDFNLLKIFGQIFFSAKARLQAEREIESLLADHKSLLRFSPTIVCKISPKGYIQSISENCHQHLAAPPSTFLGKHARHFLDRSTFRSCRIFLSSLLHPKDPNQHPLSTLDIQLKSKTNSWFRLVASAVRKPTHPSPDYFILNLRNITTEKKLQEKIKNLSLVSELTENVVIITDEKGKITWVNDAFTRFTGYTLEEVKGKSPSLLQGPATDPQTRQRMRKALLSGQPFVEEVLNYKKNGEPFWVKLSVNPQRNEEGAIIGWVSVQTDITELRNRELLLRQSEERFRTLANDLPAFVTEVLPDSTIIFINNYCAEYFGDKPENFIGKKFIDYIPESSRDNLFKFLLSLKPERPTGVSVHRVLRKGMETWQEWHVRAIFDNNGKLIKFQSIGTDISHRIQYEEKLKEATQRAQEASRAKSAFLANMSHEIRNPMSAILGLADLLLNSPLTQEQRHQATLLRTSAASLLGILNDILDLSKIEAGHVKLEPAPLNLHDFLQQLADEWQFLANQKGLSFHFSLDPNTPHFVFADAQRLRQILLNLLSNAHKFTQKGGIHFQVSAKTSDPQTALILFQISDSGIGIPPDLIPSLFDRFVQADSSISRKFGGTGLGLSICRELVNLMNGQIGANSTPGQGSTFWVEIPLPISQPPPPPSPTNQPFLPLQGSVLIVEDFQPNQIILEQTLLDFGLSPTVVSSGKDALDQLSNKNFDLILMDVQMPGMDGIETTRRIRSSQNLLTSPSVPIIALTAHALEEDRQNCLQAGMNDYLSKPIERNSLFAALKKWLPTKPQPQPPLPSPSTSDSSFQPPPQTSTTTPTPSPITSPSSEKLFDNSLILRSVNGNFTSWLRFAKNSIENLNEQIPNLSNALQTSDFPTIRSTAHKIKGLAGYLQSKNLEELASKIELAAKASDANTISSLAPHFLQLASALRDALNSEIQKNIPPDNKLLIINKL